MDQNKLSYFLETQCTIITSNSNDNIRVTQNYTAVRIKCHKCDYIIGFNKNLSDVSSVKTHMAIQCCHITEPTVTFTALYWQWLPAHKVLDTTKTTNTQAHCTLVEKLLKCQYALRLTEHVHTKSCHHVMGFHCHQLLKDK